MDELVPTFTYRVAREGSGLPLRDYVYSVHRGIPRKGIRKAVRKGYIRLDGQQVASNHPVSTGQVVTIHIPRDTRPVKLPAGLALVYEDMHIAVIRKPPGVACGARMKFYIDRLLSDTGSTCDASDKLHICRPLHRLDSPTSGLLVAARTELALRDLAIQFEQRTVTKTYTAVIHGRAPGTKQINLPLNGKEAVTDLTCRDTWLLSNGQYVSLVVLHPRTGRTHQLRKHMAMQGTPIVGDSRYGKDTQRELMLCATGITLRHPASRQVIDLKIDPPEEFRSRGSRFRG